MTRRAFTMRLKPNASVEYKQHHDNIWPELIDEIERSGIASITTFQRDDDLFLISEIADEEAWDRLWNSEVHKRWAEIMQPLMNMRDDGIVEAQTMIEIFHLTTSGNGQAPALPVTEPSNGAGVTTRKSAGKKKRVASKMPAKKTKATTASAAGKKAKKSVKNVAKKKKTSSKKKAGKKKAAKKSAGKKKKK